MRALILGLSFVVWITSFSYAYTEDELRQIDSLRAALNDPGTHDTSKIVARYELGELTMQLRPGYWDSLATDCRILYRSAQSFPEKIALLNYFAESYNNLGYVYMNQGESSKALMYYNRALKIQERLGSKDGYANTSNNLGQAYYFLGDVPNAIKYLHKALRLREALGDKEGIAYSLNNLGYIYGEQGEPGKALEYYLKALTNQDTIHANSGMALLLNNIGTVYQSQGNIQKALEHYIKSLKIYRYIGDKSGEAMTLHNMAAIHVERNEPDSALKYYVKSLEIRESIGEKQGEAYTLNNIGRVYFRNGQLEQARRYVQKALDVSNKIGYPENIRDASLLLADIYEKEGKGMQALKMHKRYVQMRDSINNVETREATIRQQARYSYEKQKSIDDAEHEKQLEIATEREKRQKVVTYAIAGGLGLVAIFLIFVFNRLRITRKQKQVIQQTNQELEIEKQHVELKALKAQINPHFIFNSLNSVQKYIMNDSKEMAQEYLSKFGKIMRSTLEHSEESAIPISDEVTLLKMYVELESKRLKYGIDFKVNIDDSIDAYNITIPPMLLQPFIENAIKHGISHIEERGLITLNMRLNEDRLVCVVTDNGIGRKASALKQQQSVSTHHRSMGMEITGNRLQNIWRKYGEEHDIEISDVIDKDGKVSGTSVKLVLPFTF